MRTNTNGFEMVWGKKPRGRGLWCFIVNGIDEQGSFRTQRYFEAGTVREAKARACHKFKVDTSINRIDEVEILP